MMRKSKKEVIFTNDDYLSSSAQLRKKQTKTALGKQSLIKIRNFPFPYNFKEYLRLALSKILFRDDSAITHIPEKGMIIGQEGKCRSLINKVLEELNRYKFKVITFITVHDLDEIDYWLQEGATIYRPGVIEVALKQLEKKQIFLEDCNQFRNKIKTNNIILLRVLKEKEENAIHIIKQITDEVEKSNSMKSQSHASIDQGSSIDDGLTIIENASINVTRALQNLSGEHSKSNLSSWIQSENSRSYNFTQNDTSMERQSFNMYYQQTSKNQKRQEIKWTEQ